MSRKRICDRCDFEIEYDPQTYGQAGSHPLPGEPSATVQSAMEIVQIDGETYELCVENGCLAEYKEEDGVREREKKEKMKDWAER